MTARILIGVSGCVTGLASIRVAGLPEMLDLLLQQDHLALTLDGQPPETLKLRQPVQPLGLVGEHGLVLTRPRLRRGRRRVRRARQADFRLRRYRPKRCTWARPRFK